MQPVSRNEIAATVIQPHFDAVRDQFVSFLDNGNEVLKGLRKTKFIVEEEIHNTKRHFAATRDDGLLMLFAPQIIDLSHETLVAILDHEFGHAADFMFPSRWVTPLENKGEAIWISDDLLDGREYKGWKKIWRARNRDQIEWAADSIAHAVVGIELRYAGDCMLQTFFEGQRRPKGLR